MEEGVEVKDLILLAGLHLTCDHLRGVGDSKSGECTEVTATARVSELYLRDTIRDGVGDDETTERTDATEGQCDGLRLTGDRQGGIVKISVGISGGVVELNLREVSHGGVPRAAVGDDYHFIISLIEMERCLTEALILRLLVNLVNTLAICAVNRKTETGKGQFRIRLTPDSGTAPLLPVLCET